MSFSQENGYVPVSIDVIMLSIMENINEQFSLTYTAENFQGTNLYKYFYALAQKYQENEIKTSEIFQKLTQYITLMNERISRPVVTPPGIIEKLEAEGYVASVKPMVLADAGMTHVCIDTDDGVHAGGYFTITSYANLVSGTDDSVGVNGTTFTAQAGAATPGDATFQAATSNAATASSLALQINSHATVSLAVRARAVDSKVYITAVHGGTAGNSISLAYTDNDTNVGATKSGTALAGGTASSTYDDIKTAICLLLSQIVVAGSVTVGLESEAVVLTNGQSFDFKYNLPNRIPVGLKLTITTSENNQAVVLDQDTIKANLLTNIEEKYALGKNFEPQRYFSVVDAPWAASVLLEWTPNVTDGTVDGGAVYYTTVYNAEYDDLFEVDLSRLTLVEV